MRKHYVTNAFHVHDTVIVILISTNTFSFRSDVHQPTAKVDFSSYRYKFVTQMLKHLQSFDALTRASKHVMTDDAFTSLVNEQFNQLVGSLRRMSIEVPEAADVMATINDITSISKSQKESLANVIASMLQLNTCTPAAANSAKTVMQTHNYMQFYLTELQWQRLLDGSTPTASKVATLVDVCLRIGLKFPTEGTTKSIIALLAITSSKEMDPGHCFECLQDFKTRLKSARINYLVPFPAPATYPADVREFLAATGFNSTEEFVASKIDSEALRRASMSIAARRTHTTVVQQNAIVPQPAQQCLQQALMQQSFQQLALRMFAPASREPTPFDDLIKVLPGATRSSRELPRSRSFSDAVPNAVKDTDDECTAAAAGSQQTPDRPPHKNLQEVIDEMKRTNIATADSKKAQKLAADNGSSKNATPKKTIKAKAKASPSKEKEKAKANPSPKKPQAKQKQHSVAESKAAWAAGYARLGASWVGSKERKSLIERMPLSEQKRRRMI